MLSILTLEQVVTYFISHQLAEQVARRFGIQVVKLDTPVDVIGFDGKASGQAGYVIGLHFQIAGRRFQKLPFLILDTGKQDLIVGRKFLEQHDIWLDVWNHRMIWPDDRAQAANCYIDYNINNLPTQPIQWTSTGSAREIKILRRELATPKAKPEHQADADRRDQRMGKAGKKRRVQWTPRTAEAEDLSMNLKEMERTLKDPNPTSDRASEPKLLEKPLPTKETRKIDIAMIGAAGFHRNCKKPNSIPFTTSLYEIDQLIEHKQPRTDKDEQELMAAVEGILPKCYHQYKHVFSKRDSNALPPHRPYDMNIDLTEPNCLSYSPLYTRRRASGEASLIVKSIEVQSLASISIKVVIPCMWMVRTQVGHAYRTRAPTEIDASRALDTAWRPRLHFACSWSFPGHPAHTAMA
ncbi:hypothetical protein ACJ73_03208 [Blastomyces percursus]|uniref:Peptidase A2 domain-containing protein n=1 Tax=Blastomyces percursus TaxID=1658174 RepID=A0A1J9QBI1_9EURO|nr:hypothetical protein ACJ73_03208 [Blastomyces percursus]